MLLAPLLLVFAVTSQTVMPLTDPPMVSSAPEPPPMPLASKPETPSEIAPFQMAALATGSVTLSNGYGALFGGRGEIDVFQVALNVTYGRSATLTEGLSDTSEIVGLMGWSVMANHWGRIRVLAGVDARSSSSAVAVGPAFGANARVGLSMLQLDLSTTLTPLPFRRLEARAALVLKGGLFELHGGYQATFIDVTTTGTVARLFSASAAGPYVALGIAL